MKYDQPLESIVLNVACTIGVIRMVIALYFDFTEGTYQSDFILDGVLFFIFVAPLTLSKFSINFNYIAVPFCIILGVLFSFIWIRAWGYEGTAEYNMIALFFLYALVFKGRMLFVFVGLLLLGQLVLVYLWMNQFDFVVRISEVAPATDGSIHFVVVVMAVTISMVYLKNKFDDKRLDLQDKSSELGDRSYELDHQNRLLLLQKKELEEINRLLEKKVKERSDELVAQNDSIQRYLEVSLTDINKPLLKTHNSILALRQKHMDDPIVRLLIQSTTELNESVNRVAKALKEEDVLLNDDRTS